MGGCSRFVIQRIIGSANLRIEREASRKLSDFAVRKNSVVIARLAATSEMLRCSGAVATLRRSRQAAASLAMLGGGTAVYPGDPSTFCH